LRSPVNAEGEEEGAGMKQMNIGIVCYPTTGGSGVVAAELGKGLAARGCKVHFVTHGLPARLSHFDENIFFHKVDPGEYPLFGQFNPYSLSIAVKIREVVDQFDLDLVHVHYAIPYATCAFLAREMVKPKQVRTITTLHGTDITLVGMMPSYYEIARFSVSVSDAITSVSEFLKEETIKAFRIEKPIRVIPNFVDCNEFRPAPNSSIRKKLAPGGERLVVHASNFRKVKNIPTVIEVFHEVKKALPARLVLIGDGPEKETAERTCSRLGIKDDVTFMGEQEFIADILPVADAFLLPSDHESFGLSALEAMSCGVPVVGSNVGGLHEVIDHGETGFLCDPHDVECMADCLISMFRNEDRRRDMGLKGRERARRNFGKDKIIEQYMDLYRDVLGMG